MSEMQQTREATISHTARARRLVMSALTPVVLCALLASALGALAARGAAAAPDPALVSCFARLGTTTFLSADASAVQQAIDAAGPNALVKVAGDCAGVQARAGTTQTVYISQSLTVQGGYTTTNWTVSNPAANVTILDAKHLGAVVVGTTDLSLAGLTVQNGSVTVDGTGSGAGIRAGGNLVLSQMTVVSNTLTCKGNFVICNGPAAYVPGSVSADRSLFLDNTCAITTTFGCRGALYAGGSAWLTSTKLIGNAGGGLYAGDAATITGSQFISNSTMGGVVALNAATVTNSLFMSNSNIVAGGGLEVFNGTIAQGQATVVDSQFIANVGSAALHSGGGGMFAVDATVVRTLFSGNYGMGAGGGLLAGTFLGSQVVGSATVTDSQFISNTADAAGGGLDSNGRLLMQNAQFISNTAGASAGAHAYSTATVSGGYFWFNRATGSGGGLGQGGFRAGGLTLSGTQFISNSAGQFGGGALAALKAVTITGAFFQNNVCGGANCLGGGVYVSNTLTVSATQFLHNTASAGGASYTLGGGTLHGSCIVGNAQAAVTNVAGTLDASNDWWGAADGPGPVGYGDVISGTVNASPFLTSAIFACPTLGLGMKLYLPVIRR